MVQKRVVMALSGGLDSTTMLAQAVHHDRAEVLAIGFEYGSRHNPHENTAAAKVAHYYSVPFRLLDLTGLIDPYAKSALTVGSAPVPEGHYEEESMRQTVVPGRNLIFTAILAGIAGSGGYSEVRLGTHAGDHFIYPDCRPDFLLMLNETVKLSSDRKVKVAAPFSQYKKVDILRIGLDLKVPYQLTRTCYKDQPTACGVCGACQERLEAFSLLGANDPIDYERRDLLPKKVS